VYLKNHLSDKITFLCATIQGVVCGVCILFAVKTDVILNFYLAADIEFKKYRVSDFLLYKSIEWSKQNNFRLYDIGTSNIGNTILEGLFDFKKKFLANGFLRMTFEVNLKDNNGNN
jgi:lipid II:glycine glycyltransferase (peptidoglycan interpeptide bridge formation enzyme)